MATTAAHQANYVVANGYIFDDDFKALADCCQTLMLHVSRESLVMQFNFDEKLDGEQVERRKRLVERTANERRVELRPWERCSTCNEYDCWEHN